MASVSRWLGGLAGIRPTLQLHPGTRRSVATPSGRVLVVGAGVAGMSAAVVLAERGIDVVVYEAAETIGGRLGTTWYRLPDGTRQPVDHGFHGFFRQYYNWRRMLSRIGTDQPVLRPLGSYPVVSRDWPDEQFDRLPPTPPLSIAALVRRSPSLRIAELVRVEHTLARELLTYDRRGTYRRLDEVTAESFLAGLGLSRRARAMLFDVFAHSFFDDAARMSAAELVAMFHFYFLANPEGLGMDAPRADHRTAIWDPLAAHLRRHGGMVVTGRGVESLEPIGGGWRVHTAGRTVAAESVIVATDAASAATLFAASPEITAVDPRLARVVAEPLVGPPYAVARCWLTTPVDARRAMFTSIGDPGVLDSVTRYELVEPYARRWSEDTGGSVLELHAYACDEDADVDTVAATMLAELGALWPETADAGVVDLRCQVGRNAAGFPVGGHAWRPGVRTDVPGVLLAGDWVDLPVPSALMERAATTGILAADAILAAHGHPVEPVWSVPTRGLLRRP